MKIKLLAFLSRYPLLHSFARSVYWRIKSLRAHLSGTGIDERRWANRSTEAIQKEDLINLNHPHRQFLIERIGAFQPVSGVLEIGCGYGPNLYWLAKKFPKIEITGIDINHLAIEEGQKFLKQEGISNIALKAIKADNLDIFGDKTFDIVLTDALLMFIGPDKIKTVTSEMLRVARRALVFMEWHEANQQKDLNGSGLYHLGCWKRNYVNLLKQFGLEDRIRVTKIPRESWPDEKWQQFGYLIEVLL
jgi:ubiquinone/menaquinone biosynthesis C-methylase UbiE